MVMKKNSTREENMKDMKILTKMMVSTFVLVALMIIMAVIYNNAGNTTSESYSNLIKNELAIEASTKNVLTSMLILRRHEKDFLLRLAPKHIDRHDKEMQVLLKEAKNIEIIAKKNNLGEIVQKAQDIQKNATDYKTKFN